MSIDLVILWLNNNRSIWCVICSVSRMCRGRGAKANRNNTTKLVRASRVESSVCGIKWLPHLRKIHFDVCWQHILGTIVSTQYTRAHAANKLQEHSLSAYKSTEMRLLTLSQPNSEANERKREFSRPQFMHANRARMNEMRQKEKADVDAFDFC